MEGLRENLAGLKQAIDRDLMPLLELRPELWRPAPATLQDTAALVQAREAAKEERRKRDRRGSLEVFFGEGSPLKAVAAMAKLSVGEQAELKEWVLEFLRTKILPTDMEEELPPFWIWVREFFRDLDRQDVEHLMAHMAMRGPDAAFSLPPPGQHYSLTWQDEANCKEELAALEYRKPVPLKAQASKSHKKRSHKKGAGKQQPPQPPPKDLITTVLSPVDDVEAAEMGELCDVCYEGESVEGNCILFCDECNVAVHQICYGVKEVGRADDAAPLGGPLSGLSPRELPER